MKTKIDEFGKAETPGSLVRWIRKNFTEDEFYDQTFDVRHAVIKHLKDRGIDYKKWPIDYCMHRAFGYIKPKRSLMKNEREPEHVIFEGYQDSLRYSNDPTNPTCAALTGAIYECFEVLQDRFYFPDSAKTYNENGEYFNVETGIGYDLKDLSDTESILIYNPSGRRDDIVLCRWIKNDNGKYILDKASTAKGLSEFANEYEIPDSQIRYYAKEWFGIKEGVKGATLPSEYDDMVESTTRKIKAQSLDPVKLVCEAINDNFDCDAVHEVIHNDFDGNERYLEIELTYELYQKVGKSDSEMEDELADEIQNALQETRIDYSSFDLSLNITSFDQFVEITLYKYSSNY